MDNSHNNPPEVLAAQDVERAKRDARDRNLVCILFRFPDESLHIIEIEDAQIASAIRGEYRFWEKPAKVVGACIRAETNLHEYQNSLPDFSNEFVQQILTLLDRIEIDGDSSLAGQRHDIAARCGYTVVIGEPISGRLN